MRIDQGVVDVLMSEPFLDVEDVLRLVVLHRRVEVSERVEGYPGQAWIVQFVRDSSLLVVVRLSEVLELSIPEDSLRRLRERVEHRHEFVAEFVLSGIAFLFRLVDHEGVVLEIDVGPLEVPRFSTSRACFLQQL